MFSGVIHDEQHLRRRQWHAWARSVWEERANILTLSGILVNLFLLLATVFLGIYAAKQWHTADATLEENRRQFAKSQEAEIAILEVEGKNVSHNGASLLIGLETRIGNQGRNPAEYIEVASIAIFDKEDLAPYDAAAEIKKECTELDLRSSRREDTLVGGTKASRRSEARMLGAYAPGPFQLTPDYVSSVGRLATCVRYQDSESKLVHHTGFEIKFQLDLPQAVSSSLLTANRLDPWPLSDAKLELSAVETAVFFSD